MSKKTLLSAVIALALLLTPLLSASLHTVDAAALTLVSDTLEDSGISADSDHEVYFKSTSGIAAAQTITLKFDDVGNAFDLTGLLVTDMTMATGTCGTESGVLLAATASGTTWGVSIDTGTDEITITSGSDTVAADDCVKVNIGDTNQITNPSSDGVYDIDVVTTSDIGLAKVSILDHVVVDVTVDETLTFEVSAQLIAECAATVADINSTATSVSYGSVNANTFYQACQELSITTNASDGYSVTVQQDGDLESAALDTIAAGTCDGGSCSVTSDGAWATASNNGFGYCVEDIVGSDAQASTQCNAAGTAGFRLFGTIGGTPEVIMSNATNVDSNVIEVGYKISVSGIQPAGTYDNDVFYVATPTY